MRKFNVILYIALTKIILVKNQDDKVCGIKRYAKNVSNLLICSFIPPGPIAYERFFMYGEGRTTKYKKSA